jgi:hypothetical protein
VNTPGEGAPTGWTLDGASAPSDPGPAADGGATSWKDWPVPVGRVVHRDGLTFVHAAGRAGFSVGQFRRIPDGRAELIDGVVVLRPAPSAAVLGMLARIYEDLAAGGGCPDGFVAVPGPVDVRVGPATVLRPDVAVTPDEPAEPDDEDPDPDADAGRGWGVLPVLVVEARPDYDTHHRWEERRAKVHGYRDAGVASYWTLNPETGAVRVYELNYTQRPKIVAYDRAVAAGRKWGWRLWAEQDAVLTDGAFR